MSYLKDGRLSKARMRPESLGLEQPSMSFWTKYYTRKASLNLIQANYVLREVHERACGNHSGARITHP